jgi:hypothetical protein
MNDASEREWEIQESAWQAERRGLDSIPGQGRGRLGRYRFIERALRTPLVDSLPDDFATQVSARVTASRNESVSTGTQFETVLLIILASTLILVAGRIFANLGYSWIQTIRVALSSLGTMNIGWLLAFLICIGMSWIWQRPIPARSACRATK